jgi:hypothetical protein
MDATGNYLDGHVQRPIEHAWTFAGHVDPNEQQDYHGLATLQAGVAARVGGCS